MFGSQNFAAKRAKNKGMIAAAFAAAIGGICVSQSAHAAEQTVGRQARTAPSWLRVNAWVRLSVIMHS